MNSGSFILPCFKQLTSIAYITKWDSMIFGWSIAMQVDLVLALPPEQAFSEDVLFFLVILLDR